MHSYGSDFSIPSADCLFSVVQKNVEEIRPFVSHRSGVDCLGSCGCGCLCKVADGRCIPTTVANETDPCRRFKNSWSYSTNLDMFLGSCMSTRARERPRSLPEMKLVSFGSIQSHRHFTLFSFFSPLNRYRPLPSDVPECFFGCDSKIHSQGP